MKALRPLVRLWLPLLGPNIPHESVMAVSFRTTMDFGIVRSKLRCKKS
jgi:hypothetical protein